MATMLEDNPNLHLSIISKGRPANVARMTSLVGAATWYVPPDEVASYLKAGAPFVRCANGLSGARNQALADAFANNLPCLQLDDDLVRVSQCISDKKAVPVRFSEVAKALLVALKDSQYCMGGLPPTNNPFFADTMGIKHQCLILASFSLVLPCDTYYDPRFILKEDYDYTLQHISNYGGVVRLNSYLAEFKHYTNKGGAVSYRNSQLEQQMIKLLKDKWGSAIRNHPTRKDEVILAPTNLIPKEQLKLF